MLYGARRGLAYSRLKNFALALRYGPRHFEVVELKTNLICRGASFDDASDDRESVPIRVLVPSAQLSGPFAGLFEFLEDHDLDYDYNLPSHLLAGANASRRPRRGTFPVYVI